jgi:hypothetical protein
VAEASRVGQNKTGDAMSLPRKVFLESTALFQLGSKLQKPEFAKLLERREYLKFDLLVSEVSWAEYIRQRADKIDELARDIKSVGARLGEWNQDLQNINTTLMQLGEFRKGVGDLYEKRAKETGIQILGIPAIDVRRLFRMSIDRVVPFEQSKDDKTEKGFRDALIMFTILTNITDQPGDSSLVVTNDGLLAKGLTKHADEFKTALAIVSDLDEAITHIDARVSSWYREHLSKESEEARAQLAKHTKEISEQVSAVRELTDFDLGAGAFFGTLGRSTALEIGESLERVNSLKVDEIDSAVWRDKGKAESRILFRVRCSASVVTSVSSTFPFFSPTKYSVGGGKQEFSSLLNAFSAPTAKQERERTLPVTLYGEAKFQRTNGDWKLSGVKVGKSQPTSEEMAALALVPQRREE